MLSTFYDWKSAQRRISICEKIAVSHFVSAAVRIKEDKQQEVSL